MSERFQLLNTRHGFTLLEVMLALFIFAIMSVMTTTVMYSVFNARDRTNQQMERLEHLQLAVLLLQRDFKQVVLRPTLDVAGDPQASFDGTATTVRFTRMGYTNPGQRELRSQVQKVEYLLQGDKLIRRTWPHLDSAPKTTPADRVILNSVSKLTLQYVTGKSLKSFWNSRTGFTTGSVRVATRLPSAVKLSLSLPDWGAFTLWLNIKGGHEQKA